MRKFAYDYTVYPDNSPKEFAAICDKITSFFPEYYKKELLVDVDGTTIQVYENDGKKIVVYDDYDVGAVFVKSDVTIEFLIK